MRVPKNNGSSSHESGPTSCSGILVHLNLKLDLMGCRGKLTSPLFIVKSSRSNPGSSGIMESSNEVTTESKGGKIYKGYRNRVKIIIQSSTVEPQRKNTLLSKHGLGRHHSFLPPRWRNSSSRQAQEPGAVGRLGGSS